MAASKMDLASFNVRNKVRALVSADRERFQDGRFDLDLSYITPNIIAMALPTSGLSTAWRNPIDDVSAMLEHYHADSYMIFNLSEFSYDYSKFRSQVMEFTFPDHHNPPLNMLFKCILSMDSWLAASPDNVAVVHCKGGKGRTGTVVACYLLYSGVQQSAEAALAHFAHKRSTKLKGVSNPSQIRYVAYFGDVLARQTAPVPRPLVVERVVISMCPALKTALPKTLELQRSKKQPHVRPFLCIFDNQQVPKRLLYSTPISALRRYSELDGYLIMELKPPQRIFGDVLISLHHVKANGKKVKRLWRLSFHTGFIDASVDILKYAGTDLDDWHPDILLNQANQSFQFQLVFKNQQGIHFADSSPGASDTTEMYMRLFKNHASRDFSSHHPPPPSSLSPSPPPSSQPASAAAAAPAPAPAITSRSRFNTVASNYHGSDNNTSATLAAPPSMQALKFMPISLSSSAFNRTGHSSASIVSFKIPNIVSVPERDNPAKTFTAYVVELHHSRADHVKIALIKRFSQLWDLKSRLKRKLIKSQYKMLEHFPPKKWFDNEDPKFVQERCRQLQAWLNSLNRVPLIFEFRFVAAFFDPDSTVDTPLIPDDEAPLLQAARESVAPLTYSTPSTPPQPSPAPLSSSAPPPHSSQLQPPPPTDSPSFHRTRFPTVLMPPPDSSRPAVPSRPTPAVTDTISGLALEGNSRGTVNLLPLRKPPPQMLPPLDSYRPPVPDRPSPAVTHAITELATDSHSRATVCLTPIRKERKPFATPSPSRDQSSLTTSSPPSSSFPSSTPTREGPFKPPSPSPASSAGPPAPPVRLPKPPSTQITQQPQQPQPDDQISRLQAAPRLTTTFTPSRPDPAPFRLPPVGPTQSDPPSRPPSHPKPSSVDPPPSRPPPRPSPDASPSPAAAAAPVASNRAFSKPPPSAAKPPPPSNPYR